MNKRRLAHKKSVYTGTEPPLVATITPDPYVDMPQVIALNDRMFDNFIKGTDVTMIFFYGKPDDMTDAARNSLRKAAQNTRREGHAYGAVNCTQNRLLCMKHSVYGVTLPAFKLYSGGQEVNVFDWSLNADDIKKFVDLAPPPIKHQGLKSKIGWIFGRGKK